jgi:hypothetical protein
MEDEVEAAFSARADSWRAAYLEQHRRQLTDRIVVVASEVGHAPTQAELM